MASSGPKSYRLRPRARDDLEAIWLYTAARWSVDQADLYIRQLTRGMELLAAMPEIARERIELTPPVRIHPVASHLIVYRIDADHIDIIRIRHSREDWASDPLGE
jgi:toxin ParE1/3/4